MSFSHIVHPVVIVLTVPVVMAFQSQSPMGSNVRSQVFLVSVHLDLKSFANDHIVRLVVIVLSVPVVMGPQTQFPTSRSVRSQAFLVNVHLEVKSFVDDHIVGPVVIVLSVPLVMALQSQSPTSCSVRSQAFLLSVRLELKSFADNHTVHLVIIVQDATILVIALDTLTTLEGALQNVIGVAFELHDTSVAVDTLQNIDVLNITIPTHLADGIILCLRNVDLLVIVASVVALLLELNFLAICLYPPAVLLHLFLDVNLDLLSHQQFPGRTRLIRHCPPLIDLWRA